MKQTCYPYRAIPTVELVPNNDTLSMILDKICNTINDSSASRARHRPDRRFAPLCLHPGVPSFCRRLYFRRTMSGAKYIFSRFPHRKTDSNPAGLKYAMKWIHTLCASVPGCDHVDVYGPLFIRWRS